MNFDDFVEQVREANPIEKVIEEAGMKLKGHGRLRSGVKHDSLKVRTDMQRFFWYSQNAQGDVFEWVMREKGVEFGEALELLARRAHIEMPRFARDVNPHEVKRTRATADVFAAAAQIFHRWLTGDEERGVKADAEALEYARGRGWKDEMIQRELIGFSGRKTAEQFKDMREEFKMLGIDMKSPAAVAVFGLHEGIEEWAAAADMLEEAREAGWIEKGHIHGLMDTPGLIYSHQRRGGIGYLTRRNLPGFDKIKDRDSGKERDWKSHNPQKELAGARQAYINRAERVDRPLICVEGQGDAISFGQLGHGALAFCGLLGEISYMAVEDAERLRQLAVWINKHPSVYLMLDDDEPGQKAIRQAANLLGVKVQIMRMTPGLLPREDAPQMEVRNLEEVNA